VFFVFLELSLPLTAKFPFQNFLFFIPSPFFSSPRHLSPIQALFIHGSAERLPLPKIHPKPFSFSSPNCSASFFFVSRLVKIAFLQYKPMVCLRAPPPPPPFIQCPEGKDDVLHLHSVPPFSLSSLKKANNFRPFSKKWEPAVHSRFLGSGHFMYFPKIAASWGNTFFPAYNCLWSPFLFPIGNLPYSIFAPHSENSHLEALKGPLGVPSLPFEGVERIYLCLPLFLTIATDLPIRCVTEQPTRGTTLQGLFSIR